jgi:MFS family permease
VSPHVGRHIDEFGGRPVLAFSSVFLGCGLLGLAFAHSLLVYFAAWLLIGIGMGAGLYDAAFSTLGRLYGDKARQAITTLTLWGGFASTVCWPLSAYLVETLGWRGACLVYAAIQLGISLPVHLTLIPGASRAPPRVADTGGAPPVVDGRRRRAVLLLGCILVLTAMTTSVVSVHLLALLQARGIALSSAVALGALIGPAQVASRIVEMTVGVRFHPIWTMLTAITLIGTGLAALASGMPVPGAALILYGLGNGIYSIARGTLPLAMFGREGYGALMGKLAMPAFLASALSPSVGAFLLDHGGPSLIYGVLLAGASVNLVLILGLLSMLRAQAVGQRAGIAIPPR